ncbi:type II toxin-antitoxin system RelE/ParE family toxin [Desulfovibrio cuneatus]|uniref:type II toxin-antitoxin system RelE/ParE family toxin n=1 Tax=Desulfovibrio cuneatus TaxID=159728 RepID=UPI000486E84B|nr:type II toxin-antitoxin system mRNA interferase toxin, RelE/StbE family [Desulfovibrio cuneatus]
MLIKWALRAQEDLRSILQYFIDEQDEETGQKLVTSLFSATARLENFPLSGKPSEIKETRELVLPKLSYILVYKVNSATVEIISVLHTSKLKD